jgi:alpha-D-xyloside xylohydrolase
MLARSTLVATAVLLTSARARADAGNAWHVPDGAEPTIVTMRQPVVPIGAAGEVVVFTGNQYKGPGGKPGNQLQTGSAVRYREVGAQEWSEAPLSYHSTSGNNKYYRGAIPKGAFSAGDIVEYYLRIPYSDHATTFLYGDDGQSKATASEATAQAQPFTFQIEWSLAPEGASLSHARDGWEARIYEASGHVELRGPVTVALAPARARREGRWWHLGPVIGSRATPDGLELTQSFGPASVVTRLSLPAEGVLRYEITDWKGAAPSRTAATIPCAADEHFYGFGEKFNALDQAGRQVRMLTADAPGDKGDQSYKVAPWFLSTRGHGFHLDASAESRFDMRKTFSDRCVVELDHGALRAHLVGGPALTDALSRFTALTGRPALPPPWAFGPWISSDHWRDGGEVRYVASRIRELGLPHSVFVFDSPWETAYNDFTWNEAQFQKGGSYEGRSYAGFATAQEMLAFLRANGFKVVLWLTPFINVTSNDEGVPGQSLGKANGYDEAAAKGYFVRDGAGGPPLVVAWWKGKGSPVDFTDAGARAWFTSRLHELVAASGGTVGGFKADDGEADFIPLAARYADGRTGVEMRNAYSVAYQRTVFEALGGDGILFARSGFVGSQAFPAHWAGDNEPNFGKANGLPSVIVAGLSAAMSGYAVWGHDIGGYQDGNPSSAPEDLFRRWTQFGALSPIMQVHRQVGAGKQYPWSYGASALDNYAFWARLHTRLFPYLYTLAAHAAETGIPILRPLVLAYPDDPATYGVEHTYLFGDALLVAPVIEKEATGRTLYLPSGGWYDFWTGERVEGGVLVAWESEDRSRLPLYVREGAIVPLLGEDVDTLCDAAYVENDAIVTPTGSLELLAYPSAPGERTLYDGTKVAAEPTVAGVAIHAASAPRRLRLRVRMASAPTSVTRDGAALPAVADAGELDAARAGYYQEPGYTVVAFQHGGGATKIVLSTEVGGGGADGLAPARPGTAEDVPEAGGCGCKAAGARASVGSLAPLWLALALGCARRRRARHGFRIVLVAHAGATCPGNFTKCEVSVRTPRSAAETAFGEDSLDRCEQRVGRDRFFEQRRRQRACKFLQLRRERSARAEDGARREVGRALTKSRVEGAAVDLRHHQVAHDRIERRVVLEDP